MDNSMKLVNFATILNEQGQEDATSSFTLQKNVYREIKLDPHCFKNNFVSLFQLFRP